MRSHALSSRNFVENKPRFVESNKREQLLFDVSRDISSSEVGRGLVSAKAIAERKLLCQSTIFWNCVKMHEIACYFRPFPLYNNDSNYCYYFLNFFLKLYTIRTVYVHMI